MAYVFNPFTGNLDTTDVVAFNGEVNAGTAGSPSLFFTGDPDTGIYSPGADQLAISTGGSGQLFVNASGRIGVGTNAPTADLEIEKTTSASLEVGNTVGQRVRIEGGSSGISISTPNALNMTFGTSNTDRMEIKSTGIINIANAPTYADDGAAGTGGLVTGDVYKTSDGSGGFNLKIKL